MRDKESLEDVVKRVIATTDHISKESKQVTQYSPKRIAEDLAVAMMRWAEEANAEVLDAGHLEKGS